VKGIVDISAQFSEESGSEFLLVFLIQFCDSFYLGYHVTITRPQKKKKKGHIREEGG
jgi:hypothetical protein